MTRNVRRRQRANALAIRFNAPAVGMGLVATLVILINVAWFVGLLWAIYALVTWVTSK